MLRNIIIYGLCGIVGIAKSQSINDTSKNHIEYLSEISLVGQLNKRDVLPSPEIIGTKINAGKKIAKGGIHQSGKVRINAPKAKMTDSNVHKTLCHKEPPRLRSKSGKRLVPTKLTSAGVIMNETAKRDMIMTTGVTARMMTNGASTVFKFSRPTRSNQVHAQPKAGLPSIPVRTVSTARSQYIKPKPVTMTAIKMSGNKESMMTFGCRQ